jgi:hypothetical protein
MNSDQEPVVLELAPLPREQIGPFLLLGVDKDAGPELIEAHWAQRVIWARKKQIRTPLGDINWAREVIRDPDRRVKADATSLNADTDDEVLAWLAAQYGALTSGGPTWKPLDVEKPLANYTLATEVPAAAEVRGSIVVPQVPEEMPTVSLLLQQFVQQPLDPWALPPFRAARQEPDA